jgi:hypothetical protein
MVHSYVSRSIALIHHSRSSADLSFWPTDDDQLTFLSTADDQLPNLSTDQDIKRVADPSRPQTMVSRSIPLFHSKNVSQSIC